MCITLSRDAFYTAASDVCRAHPRLTVVVVAHRLPDRARDFSDVFRGSFEEPDDESLDESFDVPDDQVVSNLCAPYVYNAGVRAFVDGGHFALVAVVYVVPNRPPEGEERHREQDKNALGD